MTRGRDVSDGGVPGTPWAQGKRPLGVVAALLTLLASGCGSPDNAAGLGSESTSSPDAGAGGACLTPAAGCACSTGGQTADCGRVVQTSGSYVTCSIGTVTCENGTWGACIGSFLTTRSLVSGALRLDGLGVATPCTGDPCDPACINVTDTGSGLDAGSSFVSTDAGLSLAVTYTTPPACTGLQITPNTPPATTLNVNVSMAPSPSTIQFTASLLPSGCYSGTFPALWNINQYDIAQISNTGLFTLVSPIAGPITVSAYAGTLAATPVVANVTVNVTDTSAAPGGVTAASYVGATSTDPSLTVLYPYAGTVFPLGLPPPLVQWSTSSPASSVMVTLRYPTTSPIFSWSEIVPENQLQPTPLLAAQPRATIPQSVWNDFQQTVVRNAGTFGTYTGAFAIQRIVSGTLRKEVATQIVTANGQLKGEIFYSSYGTNLVQNYQSTVGGAGFGAATLMVPVNGLSPVVVAGSNSPGTTGTGCRVCHTVSAQGTRLLTNLFSPNDHTTSTFDLTTPIPFAETALGPNPGDGQFSWAALSPDGTYLYTNSSPAPTEPNPPVSSGPAGSTPNIQGSSQMYSSSLHSLPSGTALSGTQPTNLKAAMPSFSPDAAHIAFNFYANGPSPLANPPSAPTTGDGKTISMMDFAAASRTFSNFRNLYTPSSGTAVWPVFLPPGQNGVVFEREIRNNGTDFGGTREDSSFDCTPPCGNSLNLTGATGELWWVSTATSQATVLGNLNGTGGTPPIAANYLPVGANQHGNPANASYNDSVYNYEPTVLPTTAAGYNWVVFTSRRMYGNVATINPYFSDPRFHDISLQPTPKKLWVAAVSLSPTPGTDPSFPAFYLPGQELLAGNARAYFVSAHCEAAGPLTAANVCGSNLDCCGAPTTAVCQLDPPPLASPPVSHCVATSGGACVADGSACTADAQCCSFGTGSRCASGTCAPAPPIPGYTAESTTRLYVASCPTAQSAVWRYFYWQTNTPTGTQIQFTAQTAPTGPPWGAAVSIGTAQPPPTAMTGTSTQTVDALLRAANQVSQNELLVTAAFVPSVSPAQTPTLVSWEITYDCVDSE